MEMGGYGVLLHGVELFVAFSTALCFCLVQTFLVCLQDVFISDMHGKTAVTH